MPSAESHDDRLPTSQESSSLTRRELLVAGGGLLGCLVIGAGLAVWAKGAPISVATTPTSIRFLSLSRSLTGHADLDPVLASRLYAALVGVRSDFQNEMSQLAALAPAVLSPGQLLAKAGEAGLKEAALAIVAAWYTGSVVDAMNAPMVAYRDALMYRTVSDGLPVPTYCFARPGWWVGDPPELGIAVVVPRHFEPAPPPPAAVLSTPKPPQKKPGS